MEVINGEKYIIKKEIKSININKKRVKHFCEIENYSLYNERDDIKKYGMIHINYDNDEKFTIPFDERFKLSGRNIGFEDPRVFSFKNKNYILINALGNNDNRNMYLFNIENKKIVQLKITNYDIDNIDQKNWSSYIFKDKLYFIYSFLPLVILEVTDIDNGILQLIKGRIKNQSRNKENKNKIFGSTPLIPYKDKTYVCFTHTRNPYLSVGVLYNPESMEIERIGRKVLFDYPELSKTRNKNWINVQFAYDLKEENEMYKLYIEFRNKCSGILYFKKEDLMNFF
jgi:hypothetical protein